VRSVTSTPSQDHKLDGQDTPEQAADATAQPEPAEQTEQAQPELTELSQTEPAARPRRRSRRVTRTVATTPDVLEPVPSGEPSEDEALADADETSPAPETAEASQIDVLAELAELRAGAPGLTADERPRLASTAVVFQAPDLSARPRRRRAQSQAGSPESISEAARSARAEEPADESVAPPSRPRHRSEEKAPKASQRATAEDAEATEAEPDDETVDGTEGEGREPGRRRRRRSGRGRRSRGSTQGETTEEAEETGPADAQDGSDGGPDDQADEESSGGGGNGRRRRRRRRRSRGEGSEENRSGDEVTGVRGSTRLEAKRQRRRDGRESGRRRQIITEAEFLARRESVDRQMVVRERGGRTQIAVLEDGVLVEHYVSDQAQTSVVGNVYLGRVQNVLPSMEAAFVDVGKGRNAVLYAGEVNWDAAGLDGQPRRIEQALKSGDAVLVQVTKDPIGHKGARLTSQITLAGRYLVLVPGGGMTGISHKLPDAERNRLKKALRTIVPESAGVIVRTAAEGATEAELAADIARLQAQWDAIEAKARTASPPSLLQGEPDLAIRVVRDVFNDDFSSLVVSGDAAWSTVSTYVAELAPDLVEKVSRWTEPGDVFARYRIDEQLAKGMDRKVWLPSGGSLVIDRTEAMTVIDINTGKFTGSGGTLEETVTRNNLEAAEEIVRQLRLRDIGGMIVIDFIDMVLESNRDLVLRRLVEALGRDRTKHQVAEVTSLGLVQLTRKRVGQGLVEAFSQTCETCHGRGFLVKDEPVDRSRPEPAEAETSKRGSRRRKGTETSVPVLPEAREAVKATLATIAAAAAHAHEQNEQAQGEADVAAGEAAGQADVAAGSGDVAASDAQPSGTASDSQPEAVDGESLTEQVDEP